MNHVLLEIKNLKLRFSTYEGEAKVIEDINIHVNKGEVISLVGESGCGKSVTVRSIMGLLPKAKYPQGEIIFEGKNLLNLKEEEWRKIRGRGISMIFQDPMTSLNPVFKIKEQMMNVYLYQGKKRASRFVGKEMKQEAYNRSLELLKKMRIPDPESILERYPSQLSGGMRQRVLIALALIHQPKLLIADEPGTALDVSVQEQILLELKRLVQEEGISMIFITHNLGVAREISNRIYVMYAGTVVEQAPTRKLFEEQFHPYTQGLLSSIPTLDGKMGAGIDGTIPNLIHPPKGCRFYDRCNLRQSACQNHVPELIEIGVDQKVACFLYEENHTEVKRGVTI